MSKSVCSLSDFDETQLHYNLTPFTTINLLSPQNYPRYSVRNNNAYNIPHVCTSMAKKFFMLVMARLMPPLK